MIEHMLDGKEGVLYLRPRAALDANDFSELRTVVDPYILEHGGLKGVLIEAPAFPGWDTFGAMAAHFRFVRDHHRAIKKVAIVTDSAIGSVAEHLAEHFVSAEIRHFKSEQLDEAKAWITAAT